MPAALLAVPANTAKCLADSSLTGKSLGNQQSNASGDICLVVEATHEVAVVDEEDIITAEVLDLDSIINVHLHIGTLLPEQGKN